MKMALPSSNHDKVKRAINCTCYDCGLNTYKRTALLKHHESTRHTLVCFNCNKDITNESHYQKKIHLRLCIVNVKCTVCNLEVSATDFGNHLQSQHSNVAIQCPLGCRHLYLNYRQYRNDHKSHICNAPIVMIQRQPVGLEEVTSNSPVDTASVQSEQSLEVDIPVPIDSSSEDESSSDVDDSDSSSFKDDDSEDELSVAQAWENLFLHQKKRGSTNAALDTLAKDLNKVISLVNQKEDLSLSLPRTVQTAYMRDKYVFQQCGPTGNIYPIRLTKLRQGKCGVRYYKSIKETIFELSKDPRLVNQWRNDTLAQGVNKRRWHLHSDKVYWHPLLCSRAKGMDPQNGKLTLFLEEYSDGVNHAQGSQRSKRSYEMTHAYFGIRNLAGAASRQVQYFKTHTLHFKKDYRHTEERLMWAHYVAEMKDLCSNGMTLYDGQEVNIRLFVLSGDQKELHERIGLTTCYTTDHCDRYAESLKIHRRNAQSVTDMRQNMTRRTIQSLEEDYRKVENRECNNSHGVKRRPIINTITHFHVGQFPSTSACYGHDILSGAFRDDLIMILRLWIKQGITSYVEVEEIILSFKDRLDKTLRSSYVGETTFQRGRNFTIPGNMRQLETLFCHLPLIFHRLKKEHFVGEHAAWNMMRLMSLIVRQLASFALSKHQVNSLEVLYDEYIKSRYEVEEAWRTIRRHEEGEGAHTDMSYKKPKHAIICLYPELIRELGPLSLYNTMLGESKNGLMSGKTKRSYNYKNVIKSTAKQLHIVENEPWEHIEHIERMNLKGPLRKKVLEQVTPLLGPDPPIYKRVCVNAIDFTCGDYIAYYPLMDNTCRSTMLGVVYAIVNAGSKTLFILQQCDSTYVSCHECFVVKKKMSVEVISLEDFATHKPYKAINLLPSKLDEDLTNYDSIVVPVVTPTLL